MCSQRYNQGYLAGYEDYKDGDEYFPDIINDTAYESGYAAGWLAAGGPVNQVTRVQHDVLDLLVI